MDGTHPVSYTHLDVYKRQDGGEETPDPGPEEIVIDTIDRSRPVIDVYKRQERKPPSC